MIKQEVRELISRVIAACHRFDYIDDNTMLTGAPIEISSVELVYIVLELMDKYHIVFDAEDFENYGFSTVSKIAAAVERHISERRDQI